jgi:hypothetical protein
MVAVNTPLTSQIQFPLGCRADPRGTACMEVPPLGIGGKTAALPM